MQSRYAARRPVKNSYLVRQHDRKRRRELGIVLLAVIPVASGMLGYVWLNLELVHLGYEVDRLEKTLRREEQLYRELQVESAFLTSPQQVRSRASEELGMVPADLNRLVFLQEAP